MRSKILVFILALAFSLPCVAQVQPAAQGSRVNLSIGGGIDYWRGDWGNISRFGPSAWASAEFWHGLGVNAEGHSMLAGGDSTAAEYKYVVGEGGVMYTYHHWRNFAPYAKGELGFASLGFPHKPTSTYAHDTRTTWAFGGGVEYKLWKHIWARGDYTYDGFPDFYSSVSREHHTLNPGGFAGGLTYHFRK
jgi:opacity protein-like surface antigen